jgi:uncharacterized membrane protein YjdF
MSLQEINLKQIMPIVLLFGITGGLLQILITVLPIKVWWILSVYPIVIILTVLTLKVKKQMEITYLKAFLTLVLTIILMTYILYFYIILFENVNTAITLAGHARRFFSTLGITVILSALIALLFFKRHQSKIQTI